MCNVPALHVVAVALLAGAAPSGFAQEQALDSLHSPAMALPASGGGDLAEPRSDIVAFADRPGVAPEVLAEMRGGFMGNVGGEVLELSFGVERLVSVNGEVVAATSFQVPTLRFDSSQPASLLQSGAGNSVAADIARNIPLQVIQNTLDNQVLRQITTINAAVRNLELFRAVQFGATLNRQLMMSVR